MKNVILINLAGVRRPGKKMILPGMEKTEKDLYFYEKTYPNPSKDTGQHEGIFTFSNRTSVYT